MPSKKKQFYAVVEGRKPGIYTYWKGAGGAAEQVVGYPEARYKGFYTPEEARLWLERLSRDPRYANARELLVEFEKMASSPEAVEAEQFLREGKVLMFTDGGAVGNPGPGGYGVVLRFVDHKKELSGGFRHTTNNRMEVMACIVGLRALKKNSDVVIYSDSRYLINAMTKGWARKWRENDWRDSKGNPVKNRDLWEQLLSLSEKHSVEFKWIGGHVGIPDNERCDELVQEAIRKKRLAIDVGYEQG
jgi:ribonuclease HI